MDKIVDTAVRDRTSLVSQWQADIPSGIRAAGLCWLVAAGWLSSSEFGLAVGVGVGVLGALVGPILTVAVGHAALVAVVPDFWHTDAVIDLALFEAGLVAILVSQRPFTPIVAVLTVGTAVALAAGTMAVVLEVSLVAGAVTSVGIAVAGSALLSRYGHVSLQQATASHDEQSTDQPPNETATGTLQ